MKSVLGFAAVGAVVLVRVSTTQGASSFLLETEAPSGYYSRL